MSQTLNARIYSPAKSAMQSGKGKAGQWFLEYERPAPGRPDGLMGWNTMQSTATQVKLRFDSKEAAIAYANAKGIDAKVSDPQASVISPKSYAENFATAKRKAWDATC